MTCSTADPPKRLFLKSLLAVHCAALTLGNARKENPPNADLLLLLDNDAPGVLLVAVHDVGHPALDAGRVLAAPALAHGDVDVVVAVADLRDGADEELEKSVSQPLP